MRINVNTAPKLIPLAKTLNMNLLWIHAAATVLESTLAHSLNAAGTPTWWWRWASASGDQVFWGTAAHRHSVADVPPGHVGCPGGTGGPAHRQFRRGGFLCDANFPGVFFPSVAHGVRVEQGQELGVIADPLTGGIRETLHSPAAGLLFTLAEYPVVYEGSLIARVLEAVYERGSSVHAGHPLPPAAWP